MLAMVVKEKCLRATLAFIVTRPRASGINMAPVFFGLGMHFRVAVNFAGGCLENFRPNTFSKAKHVDSTVNRRLGRLYGIKLVMDGRCRAGQIVNLVAFYIKRESHIVAQEFKMGVIQKMGDIVFASGEKIIDAQYIMTFTDQSVAKV